MNSVIGLNNKKQVVFAQEIQPTYSPMDAKYQATEAIRPHRKELGDDCRFFVVASRSLPKVGRRLNRITTRPMYELV